MARQRRLRSGGSVGRSREDDAPGVGGAGRGGARAGTGGPADGCILGGGTVQAEEERDAAGGHRRASTEARHGRRWGWRRGLRSRAGTRVHATGRLAQRGHASCEQAAESPAGAAPPNPPPPPPPPLEPPLLLPPRAPPLLPPLLGFSTSGVLLSTVCTFLSPPLENPPMAPSSAERLGPPDAAGAREGAAGAGRARRWGGGGGPLIATRDRRGGRRKGCFCRCGKPQDEPGGWWGVE